VRRVEAFESILVTVAALLPIVNPLGGAPIFLAMSADLPPQARHHLAAVVARNAFLLMSGALLVGSYVLAFFGISVPVVRVAGGLVLVSAGWRLLHAGDESEARPAPALTDAWQRELARRGFYPLTFPLTVGPGSISVAITLGARDAGDPLATAIAAIGDVAGIAIVAVGVYLSYRFSTRLIESLGETGTMVFLRLSAFVILCVGVAILWSGVVGLVEPLLLTRRVIAGA
jgi:multiple antibiotic resistance protein